MSRPRPISRTHSDKLASASIGDSSWEFHVADGTRPDSDVVDRSVVSSDLPLVPTEIVELGPILGHGAVATQPIPEGTTVAVFGGVALAGDDFAELDEHRRSVSVQVDDDVFLVPVGPESAATLINHSCAPTCRLSGQILVVAARDIEPGEPLTYDYATSDSVPYDEFECLCGERLCRRKVTGNDWMIPELQDRYRGWFSPYLERKIAALDTDRNVDDDRDDDRDDDSLTSRPLR